MVKLLALILAVLDLLTGRAQQQHAAGRVALVRAVAEHVRYEARRSADQQRAHDDAEGIKPIGTSTVNEVEWHQMGNWAHRIVTAAADELEAS